MTACSGLRAARQNLRSATYDGARTVPEENDVIRRIIQEPVIRERCDEDYSRTGNMIDPGGDLANQLPFAAPEKKLIVFILRQAAEGKQVARQLAPAGTCRAGLNEQTTTEMERFSWIQLESDHLANNVSAFTMCVELKTPGNLRRRPLRRESKWIA
ncbi:hypothetical protein E2P81_ATG01059 [Venturia nashicola]|uniref:Uncharacterized protein n=1 Tax=Venturia nashicola TaxID=86259 RepID=A0A4Z1PKP8_9PEZI|nr:hypothetical protein E6O75_ATG01079 [Venturia nashicola]TLD38516.1 hypothetical protein E2P81_ATG01059 [Venturia nashicola]